MTTICFIKEVHKRHAITIYSTNNESMMNIHTQKKNNKIKMDSYCCILGCVLKYIN